MNYKYKSYGRFFLLAKDRVKFDRVLNDIYIVATSNGSRKEVKKDTFSHSDERYGRIIDDKWVNKYIDRCFHEKMIKYLSSLLP